MTTIKNFDETVKSIAALMLDIDAELPACDTTIYYTYDAETQELEVDSIPTVYLGGSTPVYTWRRCEWEYSSQMQYFDTLKELAAWLDNGMTAEELEKHLREAVELDEDDEDEALDMHSEDAEATLIEYITEEAFDKAVRSLLSCWHDYTEYAAEALREALDEDEDFSEGWEE